MRPWAIATAFVVSGIFYLAAKRSGSGQLYFALPPTSLEYRNKLANELEAAFWYGDTRKWEVTSKMCRDAEIPGIPEVMRQRLTEQLGRDNLSE